MVHPGIVVASIFGVVVTGVVIYTILKEEIADFLESFEKPSPVGQGYERARDQDQQQNQQQRERGFAHDDYDAFEHGRGQSSSTYPSSDYELRQRRIQRVLEDEIENDQNNEKEPDHDVLMQRLRKINETARTIVAEETRLAEMERSLQEREENLRRSMHEQEVRLEQELRESIERNTRREQELATMQHQRHLHQMVMNPSAQSLEIYQNPFATNEPLIPDYNVNDSQEGLPQETPNTTTISTPAMPAIAAADISSRTANAILRHNLSSNHQENVNPFADPASLLESTSSSSVRSSVHDGSGHGDGEDDVEMFADAEDQSVTVGHDEDEDLDWTEAEIGSIGSHESDDSWVSH